MHVRALRGRRRSASHRFGAVHGPDSQEQERDHQTGDHQHGQEHGQTGDERRDADAHAVGGQTGPAGHDDGVSAVAAVIAAVRVVAVGHVQREVDVSGGHHLYDAAGVHVQLGVAGGPTVVSVRFVGAAVHVDGPGTAAQRHQVHVLLLLLVVTADGALSLDGGVRRPVAGQRWRRQVQTVVVVDRVPSVVSAGRRGRVRVLLLRFRAAGRRRSGVRQHYFRFEFRVRAGRSGRMSGIRIRGIVGQKWWRGWSVLLFVGVHRVEAGVVAAAGFGRVRWKSVVAGALGFGAVVTAHLDDALEVHVHRVGELERLEVGERHDGRGRSEVLDLLELVHDLGPDDATVVVDQLYGRPFAVVRHAVAHQHVELVLLVFNGQHHGHGLPDFHYPRHFGRPRSLAHLDLHPALQVVAQEVGSDSVQHVHLERLERDRLLVEIVPRASQLASLVPDLLYVRIVLDDDGVLHVTSAGRLSVSGHGASTHASSTARRRHAAAVQQDLERGAQVTGTGFHVHAVRIAVVTCENYVWLENYLTGKLIIIFIIKVIN